VKLKFSNHGSYRSFIERGIWPDTIKLVIRSPDSIERQPGGLIKVSKRINGDLVTVVYLFRKNEYIIITAF
jgi:hypothetical protein